MGQDFMVMHDNARPHTARVVTQWLQQHNVTNLDWPAQSPHFNLIELAWGILQQGFYNFSHIKNLVTYNELLMHLRRNWDLISQG